MTIYSLDMRAAAMAERTDVFEIHLLTFTHEDLPDPIRLSSDATERLDTDPLTYGTVSRSNTFTWVPMSVIAPGDDEDQFAGMFRIVLDAVDREIFSVIRASSTPATCLIEMVLSTDLDTVEHSYAGFETISAPYDESQVTLTLGLETFVGESWPKGRMTPKITPGLHR